MTDPAAPTRNTGLPFLDGLLGQQLGRIRRRFLIHGIGLVLAALGLLAIAYYLIDRTLELPQAVRILVSLGAATWVGIEVYRRVIVPQIRPFADADVAVALERRFPELQDRLITAHEFGSRRDNPESLRDESAAMIDRVVEEAAEQIDRVPTAELLDTSRTAKVWTLTALFVVVAGTGIAADTAAAGAFGLRVLGWDTAYPRLTNLVVELPESGPDYRVELPSANRARVMLAAGADLPLLVRAEGIIPREVVLHVDGGRGLPPQVAMTPRRDDVRRFRHVFRRIRDGMTFYASGNDDPSGDRRVEVVVVQPPRVGGIRAEVTLPAYAASEPTIIEGGAIEALAGSEVRLDVVPTARVTSATLRFLESGREVPLQGHGVTDDSGDAETFTGKFTVTEDDRYQVELVGSQGLRNPNPGVYPVAARPDLPPAGRIVHPDTGSSIDVYVPGARLPVRVTASDDYGLSSVLVHILAGRGERSLDLELMPPNFAGRNLVAMRLLTLTGNLAATAGESITVGVDLADRRTPTPLTTRVTDRTIYIVEPTELARRVSGHFRRIREEVESAIRSQATAASVLTDVLESATSLSENALRENVQKLEVGEGQVASSAKRSLKNFMRAFDTQFCNGMDGGIDNDFLHGLYLEWFTDNPTEESHPVAFYRAVDAARIRGSLGNSEGPLGSTLLMLTIADDIANRLAPSAIDHFKRVLAADSGTQQRVAAELAAAAEDAKSITAKLDELLSRLDRWNEFQDVLSMAQAIRNAQLDIQNRTREVQGGK